MKQIIITSVFSLGIMLCGFSTSLASVGDLAVAQTRIGSAELNPQPEPPGVTERKVKSTKLSTSTKACIKSAKDAKNKDIAAAKIDYNKAIQVASQAQDKELAYAKTLTDKATKKAAILKAHRDFAVAKAKARSDKNSALSVANQTYKNAILACKAPSTR